jgi:hypothetical protein
MRLVPQILYPHLYVFRPFMFGFVICDITNEYEKWSNVKHMLKVCMLKYFQNHLVEMIKTCNIVMLLILLFTKN